MAALWGINKQSQTKPIPGDGKCKRAKGKMRVIPDLLWGTDLKKQSQC